MARLSNPDTSAWRDARSSAAVTARLRELARPLATDADLDPLIERVGDARYVLLGEASHGTAEFYAWRTRLTARLIAEKGFSFVAVEGDWPDCERVNRYVKRVGRAPGDSAREVLAAFDRWPTWMWANAQVVELAEWLRQHNAMRPAERKAGFYGLDVYSLWDSMRELTAYLDRADPQVARVARRVYECFAPFGEDERAYARATALVTPPCEAAVVELLREVRARALSHVAGEGAGGEGWLSAEQNALIVHNAEHYYQAMVRGGAESWNVRDRHMFATLERLMAFHGPGARAIVWAHNTHVGDARFTDMARGGEVNLGQLVREAHGEDEAVVVGFATHRGTVIAGDEWGAPMERMPVPPATAGSVEDALHGLGGGDALLLFQGAGAQAPELLAPRGHRAIGVVYHPAWERFGNYVPTVLPRRYDALLYVDESHAVAPLHMAERGLTEPAETFPTGM